MKKTILNVFKWSIPVFFLFLGFFFYAAVHGHSFLGLVCIGISGVILCYYLLGILARRRFMPGKVLRTVFTSLLLLGICAFGVTEAIILAASTGAEDQRCDYVIVLGAKVNGTAPSLSLSDRIQAAEDYLKAHPDTIAILSGGQGPDEGISEAECMLRELTARGIAPERLWLEGRATSTWENLNFSLDIIEEKTGTRPERVGLLSSEYHLYRAGLFAKECGVEAITIPAATSWLTIRLNYFMREVAGVWHYMIFGG